MNDMTNVTNEVAADLAAQLADGTAEVVEVKGNLTGKLVTGGIALGATAGAGILGWFLGRRHERKKWETFDDEDLDNYDEYEEFEDEEDFNEVEEPTDTKAEEKTDEKPEK